MYDYIFQFKFTVNGNWGQWSEYNECSATCGGGQQMRTRQCNDPPSAHGGDDCLITGSANQREKIESELWLCNADPCPGKKVALSHTCHHRCHLTTSSTSTTSFKHPLPDVMVFSPVGPYVAVF